MLDRFLQYLTFEKRFSPHTVTGYQTDLTQFAAYLSQAYDHDDLTTVDASLVRSWVAHLMERLSAVSVGRKLTTLRTFYRFLLREGAISRSPMQEIVSPKKSKRLPVFVEEDRMVSLLDELSFPANYEGERDRLILELFYSTGLRRAELISLKVTDFDLRPGDSTMRVLGKRSKERIIPLSEPLQAHIERFLGWRQTVNTGEADNLFLTVKGKALYPTLVYKLVNRYLGQVTTSRKRSPHVLRHTFATHMLNSGADLNAIKELLGHANLAATQIYTHSSFEKLKAVHADAHPRAK